jgi:hypothetical protein
MKKLQTSVLKPFTLAATIVLALSTWASAATHNHRGAHYYGSARANTNAAANFQNQFNVDY